MVITPLYGADSPMFVIIPSGIKARAFHNDGMPFYGLGHTHLGFMDDPLKADFVPFFANTYAVRMNTANIKSQRKIVVNEADFDHLICKLNENNI